MKFRSIIAGVLCAVVCANTAFAAQTSTQEKMVLTYDKAVELAIKNNSNISTLEEAIDLMEKNQETTVDRLGNTSVMTSDSETRTMNATKGTLLTTAKTMESNIKTSKYNKQLIETGCEYLVKSYFNNIQLAESGLELLKKNYSIQQDSCNQDLLKFRLGMISKNDLTASQNSLAKMKSNVEQTELAIANAYDGLANALGLKTGTAFEIDYTVEYTPFELGKSVESYISTSLSKDPSIKIYETKLELAKKLKSISVYSTQIYSYLEKENNVSSASRELKDAKDAMEKNITAAYNNIKKYEAERASLEAALSDAQTTYETAKINCELGNITDFQLKQAELGVLNAENNLLTNACNHDLEIFGFNNPSMLGSASAQ